MESFYFVCCGQTAWSAQGLLMGQQDIPLNEVGCQQAQEAAKVLAGHELASLCHSSLSRAAETAHIVALKCPCSLHPLEDLNDRGWGECEGKKISPEEGISIRGVLPEKAESEEYFRNRVLKAFIKASQYPVPVLFVSDLDVFYVICKELNIDIQVFKDGSVVRVFKELGKWRIETL